MPPYTRLLRRRRSTTAPSDDQAILDPVPAGLRDAAPQLPPAVLFTAWSLATHGHSATSLQRHLGLCRADADLVLAHIAPTVQSRTAAD